MNHSLVSIIMPAYNAEKFIAESIESVISQTYTNWELIIINDGSTDNTQYIIDEYTKKDVRILSYYQENGKQGKARNNGLSRSKGDLIAFLDSDDLWLPQKIEISVDEFYKRDQDVLFTNTYIFNNLEDLKSLKELPSTNLMSGMYFGMEGLKHFLYLNRIPMLTVLIKKDAILSIGGFKDRGIAEDYQLWLSLLASGYKIRAIEDILSLYRIHSDSTTSADKLATDSVLIMLVSFFSEYPDLAVFYKEQIIVWIKRLLDKIHKREDLFTIINSQNLSLLRLKYKVIVILNPLQYVLPLKIMKKIVYKILVWQNLFQ